MLLLNINRKAYMGIPKTLSHLTLSDLERSKSGSSNLDATCVTYLFIKRMVEHAGFLSQRSFLSDYFLAMHSGMFINIYRSRWLGEVIRMISTRNQ